MRQQFVETIAKAFSAGVCQDYRGIGGTEFRHDLQTESAGGRWGIAPGYHRNGLNLHLRVFAPGLKDGYPLGADGGTVAGVLYVAPAAYAAVRQKQGGAHLEPRVGAVGILPGGGSCVNKLFKIRFFYHGF